MLKITIENAQVIKLDTRSIELNGTTRRIQEALIMVNGRDGVQTHQVEVWDDSIETVNLQPNETATLQAFVISRQKDGRWYNTIRVYRAERGAAPQATTQVQTDEDTF